MKSCPSCGFHHNDLDVRCIRCDALLDARYEPDVSEMIDAHVKGVARRPRFVALRGALGRMRVRYALLIARLVPPPPQDVNHRDPWLAGFLSLIPGVGQIYNAQSLKALYFVMGWAMVIAIFAATFYHPYNVYVMMAAFVWAAYAFHDGFKTAVQINAQFWHLRRSLTAFVGWLVQIALFSFAAYLISSAFFMRYRSVGGEAFTPFFRLRDRVAIDIISYKFRDPKIGEVVYYDPAKVKLETGSNTFEGSNAYVIDPLNDFERIVGGPGDTFERRAGRYYRNGQPIDSDDGPIATSNEIQWDFKLVAPEDHYIVLFSHTTQEITANITPVGPGRAPRLDAVANRIGWKEACVVHRARIFGRVAFVYHPPPSRRYVRRRVAVR